MVMWPCASLLVIIRFCAILEIKETQLVRLYLHHLSFVVWSSPLLNEGSSPNTDTKELCFVCGATVKGLWLYLWTLPFILLPQQIYRCSPERGELTLSYQWSVQAVVGCLTTNDSFPSEVVAFICLATHPTVVCSDTDILLYTATSSSDFGFAGSLVKTDTQWESLCLIII